LIAHYSCGVSVDTLWLAGQTLYALLVKSINAR